MPVTHPDMMACMKCGADSKFTGDSALVKDGQFIQKYTYKCSGCGIIFDNTLTHGASWKDLVEGCKQMGLVPEDVQRMIIESMQPELLEGGNNE